MVTWFRRDRRNKYRVEPEELGDVEVNLVLSSQRLLPGELINMSLDGNAVFFPAKEWPDLTPNERVMLKIVIPPSMKSITIDALVKDSCMAGGKKLCRFQFAKPATFLQKLDPSLGEYFNRRKSFRVEPDQAEPIKVMLEWQGGFAQGRIIDISTAGMGLELDPELARTLGHADLLTLSFHLPGSKIPLKLAGKLLTRKGGECSAGKMV
jgi:hypothetical protein